jgi:lipoprotein-anchoring transpeptidase ErfK/SrfK
MHQVTLWHKGAIRNTWLVRGGGYTTPTRTGNTKVYLRDKDHVSGLYNTPMPYSQFFDGGQALHGSAYMINPFVDHSHGCVNMYIEDARQLWKMTHSKRLHVSVYGAWD